jgi:predicted RNA methylase
MKTLQSVSASYTVTERAAKIYGGVLDIFDYNTSNDVVTPLNLARMQVRQCGKIGTMCVPGAGIGTYVLAALLEGFDPEDITAIESDAAYYGLGSGIFSRFGVNYVHADFLTWKPNMKFDVVIGNPPYQDASTDSKDKKLWTKFVFKSLELLNSGGHLCFLTPNSLVGRTRLPAKMRTLFSSDYSLLWMNHDANTYFPSVGVDICSWCVKAVPYEGATVVVSDNQEREIDLRNELPLRQDIVQKDNISEKIYANVVKSETPKLEKKNHEVRLTEAEQGQYKIYHSGRSKYYFSDEKMENQGKWKVVFSFSATYKQWFVTQDSVAGSNYYVEVESPEAGIEIGNTLLHPVMMFYIDNWRRTSGFTPAIANKDTLPDIRGLSDGEVYRLFELTAEDVDYIESNVKPYDRDLKRVL